MNSYMQQNTPNSESFDWQRILQTIIEDNIDPKWSDYQNMVKNSNSWVTCAVGNQYNIIPRNEDGEPKDPELNYLGWKFNIHIKQQNWIFALETLGKIEKRSTELINEILQNGK